jgi:hypothetical protein
VENPENRELVEAWVQAVFPLILDVETKEWKSAMQPMLFMFYLVNLRTWKMAVRNEEQISTCFIYIWHQETSIIIALKCK